MSDAVHDVQAALYATLGRALDVPVYADPEGASYPYVTLDAVDVRDEDFLDARLDRQFAYLSVWSAYAGMSEVLAINAQIQAALHRQTLKLASGTVVAMRVIRRDVARDVDELTYIGSITVELLVMP